MQEDVVVAKLVNLITALLFLLDAWLGAPLEGRVGEIAHRILLGLRIRLRLVVRVVGRLMHLLGYFSHVSVLILIMLLLNLFHTGFDHLAASGLHIALRAAVVVLRDADVSDPSRRDD